MRLVLTTSPGGYLKNNERKIAIRVDASASIGTGHFMRCLTLADELKQYGSNTFFVCRHLPDHLRELLADHGHGLMLINTEPVATPIGDSIYANWLGTSQEVDARDTLQVLSDETWDWLVVDHYALDARWETALRQKARHILVIDDIANRSHDCDVMLDQNFYSDMNTRYVGKVPENCQLLLGPHYALLRKEFRLQREKVVPRAGPVRRILVFFGGIDADNYTGFVIQTLAGLPDIEIDVVIGAQHPSLETIETECHRYGFMCHIQTKRMAELMALADLSIGAGGSATWERCCLGLPTLTVALAENQIAIATALDIFGACLYLGEAHLLNESALLDGLNKLIDTSGRLMDLSEKAYSMVDGMGTLRTCHHMGYR